VTSFACFSASYVFIQPFFYFQGDKRCRKKYKQNLPTGSQVATTVSDYLDENILLEWLQHFLKHSFPGKSLLFFDGHVFHFFLRYLDY
jgi:hypothetical protein